MAIVEIRDHSIWVKHIHGDANLSTRLARISSGTLVELTVDGFKGIWCKMDDGKDGRPTDGIKPIGPAQKHWHSMQSERGKLVEITD